MCVDVKCSKSRGKTWAAVKAELTTAQQTSIMTCKLQNTDAKAHIITASRGGYESSKRSNRAVQQHIIL